MRCSCYLGAVKNSLNTVDIYSEGERISRLAVKKNVSRDQLRNIAVYAKSEGASAARYLIRKQVSRGLIPVEFGGELETLLDVIDPSTFSKIMFIAYDLYNWSRYELTASILFKHIGGVKAIIQEYASRERLGEAKVSIWFKKEDGIQLKVIFDKPLSRSPREVARFIERSIRDRIVSLKNVAFEIWIGRRKE